MRAVSIDEFFTKNLVNNLADLLGIDKSLIRVVDIISENSRRRRRSSGDVAIVQLEIADPPLAANGSSSSNYTGMEKGFSLFCAGRCYCVMILRKKLTLKEPLTTQKY